MFFLALKHYLTSQQGGHLDLDLPSKTGRVKTQMCFVLDIAVAKNEKHYLTPKNTQDLLSSFC